MIKELDRMKLTNFLLLATFAAMSAAMVGQMTCSPMQWHKIFMAIGLVSFALFSVTTIAEAWSDWEEWERHGFGPPPVRKLVFFVVAYCIILIGAFYYFSD